MLFFISLWAFLGTTVMIIIATDADDKNTDNAKISYSIVEHTNMGGMFMINSQTGEVSVRRNTLDREVSRFSGVLKFISWKNLQPRTQQADQ